MASYYMYLHFQQQAKWFEDIMDWAVGVDFMNTYVALPDTSFKFQALYVHV